MAPIAVGDRIPDATLTYLDDDNQSQKFNLHEKLKGKKAVFIGVPGAFTPTWSQKHIPSLIELSEEIKSKGVSDIIVVSVNDQYVMKAWERSFDGAEDLQFLADGSADFTEALDLVLDLSEKGLGKRSRQYSLLVNDLVVENVNLDEDGQFADFEEGGRRGAVKIIDLDEGGQFDDFEKGGQWSGRRSGRRSGLFHKSEEGEHFTNFEQERRPSSADLRYLLAFVVYEHDQFHVHRAEREFFK